MNFVDYCIYTKNYSTLDVIDEYNRLFSGHKERVRKMLDNMQGQYIHMTPVKNVNSILKNGFRPSEWTTKANNDIPSISSFMDDNRDNSIDNELNSYRKIDSKVARPKAMNYYQQKKNGDLMRGEDFTRYEGQKGAVDGLQGIVNKPAPVNFVMNTNAKYRGGTDAGESVITTDDANKALADAKLRIPFGAVSPENANQYVPLMRDHSSRLDMDDTYTRRMYNLYKNKVADGFDPVTMKQKSKYIPFQYISNWVKHK